MNVAIEEKKSFQILAVSREVDEKTCFAEIPKFREEYYAKGNGRIACGQHGVCYGGISNEYREEKRPDGTGVYHVFNCPDRTETQRPDYRCVVRIPLRKNETSGDVGCRP